MGEGVHMSVEYPVDRYVIVWEISLQVTSQLDGRTLLDSTARTKGIGLL